MIRFYAPRNNLGCAGIRIGDNFYVDLYQQPHLGIYLRIRPVEVWASLTHLSFNTPYSKLLIRPFSQFKKLIYRVRRFK